MLKFRAAMLVMFALASGSVQAGHATYLGAIDSIDHTFGAGGGTFSGFAGGQEDDWLVFGANAGDVITINASGLGSKYKSMRLLQDTTDGNFQVGDLVGVNSLGAAASIGAGVDLEILAVIGANEFNNSGSLVWNATYTGQYGIGISAANDDNFWAGNWTVSVSGNTANVSVPVPASIVLLISGLLVFGFRRIA